LRQLALGKIPIDILNSTVLRMTGADSARVVTPPKAGIDFAAVRLDRGFLVVSADPITGVVEEIGRYAVKVSANDVATSGNRPQFAESVVLLPKGSTEADVERVAKQVHEAARESGITILGGHTEVTPGLRNPIVIVTVFSVVERYVTSGDARAGDIIMMTKTAGLEGTAELAREPGVKPRGVRDSVLAAARAMISQIGVTEEAVAAFRTGRVHAMHDCTEGGVLGAVYEMSVASELGFTLSESLVPVAPETAEVCRGLSIDPLRLIGSGSLLLAVEPGAEEEVGRALAPVCRVTRVGEFRAGSRKLLRRDGSTGLLREAPEDELWRVLSRPRRRGRRQ